MTKPDFAARLAAALRDDQDAPHADDLLFSKAEAILALVEAAEAALEVLDFIDSEYGLANPRPLRAALEALNG